MSRENVDLVRRLYDDLAQGKFRGHTDLFDPDIELQRSWGTPRSPDVWRGLEAFAQGMREYIEAFRDLRVEGEEFIDLGDRVLVHTRHRGLGKGSGIPYEKEITDVVTVRDGLIVRWATYWNRAEALEAVGLRE
jgi:ketosteroid isomerase-like protein